MALRLQQLLPLVIVYRGSSFSNRSTYANVNITVVYRTCNVNAADKGLTSRFHIKQAVGLNTQVYTAGMIPGIEQQSYTTSQVTSYVAGPALNGHS